MNMDIIAKRIVKKYVEEHLDKSDKCISNVDTEPYFVWKCKTLLGWNCLSRMKEKQNGIFRYTDNCFYNFEIN